MKRQKPDSADTEGNSDTRLSVSSLLTALPGIPSVNTEEKELLRECHRLILEQTRLMTDVLKAREEEIKKLRLTLTEKDEELARLQALLMELESMIHNSPANDLRRLYIH
jgi:predicted RNase H-like nuclease (RuvC/YqgF family)